MIEIIKSKTNMLGKLFVYQIAMSLLGLFIVSPFDGKMQIAAAVFSTLFYFSLVAYAIIEDGQKDYLAVKSGRLSGNACSGLVYSLVAYLPTVIIVLFQMILTLTTSDAVLSGLKSILNVLIRFFLMGMYLGFDTGLAGRTEDPVTHQMVSTASKSIQFMSDNFIIFAIMLVLVPIVCGLTYYLAYNGKVHVNTEVKNKK